jgi:hypothetical protein
MQAEKNFDGNGQWTVQFYIPGYAVITLHARTKDSAEAVCKALTEHVTASEFRDLRTTVKPARYQGIVRT